MAGVIAELVPADFMRMAVRLSLRALGASAENPPVGCVLVKDTEMGRRVIGRGWTQANGRPHAETCALAMAGGAAKGAEAYVTLEPCAHHGKTPPCAEALIGAGVRRVYVAMQDPDDRVNGKGLAMLREAGIETESGLLADEAEEVLAPYLMRRTNGRPLITLKLATSLDGKIATETGESQWITGEQARRHAHFLRAQSDAIMIGAKTAREDNPSLICRLAGLEARSPVRIVADASLSLSPDSNLAKSAGYYPVLLFATPEAIAERGVPLAERGVELIPASAEGGKIDIPAMLGELARRGVSSLLVEGGAGLAASFLRAGLVDRLIWFAAPLLLGQEGRSATGGLEIARLADAHGFTFSHPPRHLGEDIMLFARRK